MNVDYNSIMTVRRLCAKGNIDLLNNLLKTNPTFDIHLH